MELVPTFYNIEYPFQALLSQNMEYEILTLGNDEMKSVLKLNIIFLTSSFKLEESTLLELSRSGLSVARPVA